MNNKNLEFLDLVSLGSAGLGIYNTILNQQQISNDDLLKELLEFRNKEIEEISKRIKEDNNRILSEILKEIRKEK